MVVVIIGWLWCFGVPGENPILKGGGVTAHPAPPPLSPLACLTLLSVPASGRWWRVELGGAELPAQQGRARRHKKLAA